MSYLGSYNTSEFLDTCGILRRLADVDVRPQPQFQLLLELMLKVVHGVREAPASRQIGLAAMWEVRFGFQKAKLNFPSR